MRSVVEVGASVPAFLGKLWKLVNDSETDHLISWSPGWKTFIIKNQAEFARSLLPLYYKHNNMASFIRQLNMYGFHKITSVENGGLRYEKDEIEFSHPCFMKGHAYLLEHIKRKIANPKSMVASNEGGTKLLVKPELMTKVLADVKQMKGKQESMDAKFSVMKQENEALWREVALLRQKHIKQQQIVNNLIQFLMSLVQPSRTSNMNAHGVKRRYQLMINDAAHNSHFDQSFPKNPKLETDLLDDLNDETLEEGPTIHELVHDDIIPTEETPESPVDPNNFVTIDIPGLSPNPRPGSSATPTHYQVTLEDGEDPETGTQLLSPYHVNSNDQTQSQNPAQSPVVTSPSPDFNLLSPTTTKAKASRVSGNHLLSPSQYTMSPATDMRLPADIFASDDSTSEACAGSMPEINTPSSSPAPTFEQSLGSKDMLLTTAEDLPMYNNLFLSPQPVNAKLEKSTESNKRSKKQAITDAIDRVNIANIKTELQDGDWNNMTLAKVNNNGNLSRVPSMNLRDIFNNNEGTSKFGSNKSKNELDDHLDTMQSDLESLRELLRTDSYSLDANTLLGLFGQEDPFYGLNFNTVDDRTKGNANNAQEPNQLMSYTGNVPDFGDFTLPEDSEVSQDPPLADSLLGDASTLNTPQVTMQSPFYPTTNK